MLSEELQLITQLSQLSTKYRSKGLKYRDIKSVVDLISVFFEDSDVLSDEFAVGLFSSLLDMCILSATDKRSAVKLGQQVGKLLVKILHDCALWSVFQKCGVGILALLEVMVDVNKSIELTDCSLHIQDGKVGWYTIIFASFLSAMNYN
jgi:hypothetical protein